MNAAGELSDEVTDALLAPDFRIEEVSTAVTDNTFYGAAGAREWVSKTFETFDEGSRYEVEEVLVDGEDFVVARHRVVGHGVRSGAPLDWSRTARWCGRLATRAAVKPSKPWA